MALFGSKDSIKVEYKDFRTNMRKITFEDGKIKVKFDGHTQEYLDILAEDKAFEIAKEEEKNRNKGKGLFKKIFDYEYVDEEVQYTSSEFAFKGDDFTYMAIKQSTVQQIAEDAFKFKAIPDTVQKMIDDHKTTLQEKLDEIKKIRKQLKSKSLSENEETEFSNKLEVLEEQIDAEGFKFEVDKEKKRVDKLRKELNSGTELDGQLVEYTMYVAPMGLSHSESDRFTALPVITIEKKRDRIDTHKIKDTRIEEIWLESHDTGDDDDNEEDDYTYDLVASIFSDGEFLNFQVNGYFKEDTLKQIDDTSFTVVNYLTGREDKYYLGYHNITTDPNLVYSNPKANPNNQDWFKD